MKSYGIKASKSSNDVLTADDVNLLFSSKFPMFKVKQSGSTTLTIQNTQLNGALSAEATTVNVDSTTNFPSSGWIWVRSSLAGFTWEAISYTGITATSFTGCSRGYLSSPNSAAADNDLVTCGYNELRVTHSLGYPPVHFSSYVNTVDIHWMLPFFEDPAGVSIFDTYVTSTDFVLSINFTDFNVDDRHPTGTSDTYNFLYTIMYDSITTPYY